ncbi:hypothetical protein [Streptomyces carminius]|uniref:hypothetical protein n=1 Tax=Streptomyces carminius TaxID=2665496 RepID=UPI0013043E1E|nr:hypothetical protein [Streptomyces carminius]
MIATLALMFMGHRQERANERNEAEAINRTAVLARSYVRDVLAAPAGFPGREAVRGIAERHDGRLVSYVRSEGSLTTTVKFFGRYEDTSMFGVSHSWVHRCCSAVFREDAADGLRGKATRLEKCDVG